MERTISNKQVLIFFLGTTLSLLVSACASVPSSPEETAAAPEAAPSALEDAVVRLPPRPKPSATPARPVDASVPERARTVDASVPEPARAVEPEPSFAFPPGDVLVDISAAHAEVLVLMTAQSASADTYENVWDRLRAGFQLQPLESPLVEQHERWIVENAEFRQAMFARAQRYLYFIVEEVDKRGLPLEIALLPAVESAYKPYAYSRARASGLWQFIPSTGRLYGLKSSWWYDGRRDIVASTRAALDYLEKLVADFDGDWHLALAAYNAGEGRIMRAVRWNQARGLPTDFAHLRQIKRETKYYVPKLQAMVNIVSDPARYGIELPPIPNAPYFTVVEADSQVDLGVIARLTGMDPDELHYINPGYRRWATDPSGPHHLLVPVDKKDAVVAGLNSLPEAERVQWLHHQVRRGDTLYDIARRYGITVLDIKRANRMRSSLLRIGQSLMLPISAHAVAARAVAARPVAAHSEAATGGRPLVHRVRRGDTLYEIARHHGLSVAALKRANRLRGNLLRVGQRLLVPVATSPVHASAGAARAVLHKVRRGETLSEIAHRYGVLVRQLAEWNLMDPHDVLHMGRTLKIWINSGPQAFHHEHLTERSA